MRPQAQALARRPHIVVATPGRLAALIESDRSLADGEWQQEEQRCMSGHVAFTAAPGPSPPAHTGPNGHPGRDLISCMRTRMMIALALALAWLVVWGLHILAAPAGAQPGDIAGRAACNGINRTATAHRPCILTIIQLKHRLVEARFDRMLTGGARPAAAAGCPPNNGPHSPFPALQALPG